MAQRNVDELASCVDRAQQAMVAGRNASGYWEGRLASSPLGTAVSLCALEREDISEARWARAHAYLAKTQNADGGWGDTEISVSNLAASLLVQCADAAIPFLKEDARRRAQAYTDNLGGVREGLRRVYGKDLTFQVPIRMTAAYTRLAVNAASGAAQPEHFPWSGVDALPFELALAPRSLMGALRLPVVSYALPALVSVGLSRHAQAPSWFAPLRWWREHIADRALEAILNMQPESGGYLEASPITAFCLIGLKAAGRGDHAVARNALRFLVSTQRDDGSWPVEVNLSVWNTTRAIDALAAGGLLDTALTSRERATTRDWLLAQQCTARSVYSDTQPGGWGWNHLSGSVPDVDDTSGAIIALRHLGVDEQHTSIVNGRRWLMDIQNRDGGFPTFCRGWNKLPFDKSAPDLTAHALRACPAAQQRATASALNYLSRIQNTDGSFAPLWFGCEAEPAARNLLYGTTSVLFALSLPYPAPIQDIRNRALSWLASSQNSDGGFGGCVGAVSTAEETGLALRALVAHGYTLDDPECQRAAGWLAARQRADGSWNPAPIGFYFAVLWYYEELYPLYYALGGLSALAKTRHGIEAATAA